MIDEYLNTVLTDAEKINEYDYSQMMTEFESMDTSEALRRSKVKKFRELNNKWKKTLALMKNKKEEIQEEAQNKRIETMANKKSVMDKIIKENEEKKQQILDEMKSKSKESVDYIKNKNKIRAEQIENERIQNEKKTHEKVHRISEYRTVKMNEFKETFTSHTAKSIEQYKHNWSKLQESKEKFHQEMAGKAFEKFAGWVKIIYN